MGITFYSLAEKRIITLGGWGVNYLKGFLIWALLIIG